MVRSSSLFLIIAAGALAFFLNCGQYATQPDRLDTLPVVGISIEPQSFSELLKSAYLTEWHTIYLIDSTGTTRAKIRPHGSLGRKLPKKSFKIEVLDTDRNRFPATTVISAQYPDKSLCRYALADYFFRRASMLTPRIRHVAFFVNGELYGLYLQREPIDKHFLERNGLPISSVYQTNANARFSFGHGMLAEHGWEKEVPDDDLSYGDLERLITTLDRGITENRLDIIGTILDLRNTLDYIAVSYITANRDGYEKNAYLYFNPRIRKFQFIPWDLDLTFGKAPESIVSVENGLFEKLAAIPSCSTYIRERIGEIFDLEEALAVLDSLQSHIAPAYTCDPWLAADPKGLDRHVATIRSYLRAMHQRLVKHGIESP